MIDQNNQAITSIMVRGFKSLADESRTSKYKT